MNIQDVDLFVHCEAARPRPVRASIHETLASALKQAGVNTGPGLFLFVGESEHALAEAVDIEDGDDAHEATDPNQTLAALGLHHGGHVHCHRCHRVTVSVNYEVHTKRHRFSPATTILTATGWAKKKFSLTDNDAQRPSWCRPAGPKRGDSASTRRFLLRPNRRGCARTLSSARSREYVEGATTSAR